MGKRIMIGLIIGCVLSFSITFGFGVESVLLSFVIALLCGAASVSIALSFNKSIYRS